MAKKDKPQDVAVPGFWLLVLGALGTAGLVVFNFGKDVGAYEERLAQLERRVDNPVENIN